MMLGPMIAGAAAKWTGSAAAAFDFGAWLLVLVHSALVLLLAFNADCGEKRHISQRDR